MMSINDHLKQIADILNDNVQGYNPPKINYVHQELTEVPNIINGPRTLSQHLYKNKRIYIFGEHHHFKTYSEEESISISDFLHHQVHDKVIDVFLELGYKTGASCTEEGELCEIRNKLILCSNLRFHYSDVRIIQKDMSAFTALITGLYYNLNEIRYNDALKEPVMILLNQLRRVLASAHEEDLIDFLIFQNDINGELYGKLDIPKELRDYLNSRMTKEGYTKISLLTSINSVFETQTYEQLAVDLTLWQSFILDVYILTMILQDPQNIIIYNGDLHSQRQREFLGTLGSELINHYTNTEDWIDISSFKLPFFS